MALSLYAKSAPDAFQHPASCKPRISRRNIPLIRTLIKLGGSLLTLPDLPARLTNLLQKTGPNSCVLVGGGATAELVREWDVRFGLGDDASHQLAIQAMLFNTQMVAAAGYQHAIARSIDEAGEMCDCGKLPILDPVACISNLEQQLPPELHLAASWNVTSDSIAAWLATHHNFDRMLLVKSVDLPENVSGDNFCEALQAAGLLDSEFATHATAIPQIDWCNLRAHGSTTIQRLR